MKKIIAVSKCVILSIGIIFIFSCSFFDDTPKPKYFGIYLVDKNELVELNGQKVSFSGNLMNSIVGIKSKPEKCILAPNSYIILYSKDIPYKSLKLTKLQYQTFGNVNNIIGKQMVEVQMWVKERDIELKVAPLKGKDYMYKLVPVDPLETGLYSVNFGNLGDQATISIVGQENKVYPFCFGNFESQIMELGINVKNANFYTVDFESGNAQGDYSNLLSIIDERIKENFSGIYYGIYPLSEQSNRVKLQFTLSGTKGEKYKLFQSINNCKFVLLADRTVRGSIGFLLRGGGAYVQIDFNSPIELDKTLALSKNSFIQQPTDSNNNQFFIWLSAAEYADLGKSVQAVSQFFERKLGKPGSSYSIRMVELVNSRYNINPFIK